ncbi:MAG: cytochrome ubiquinol oxidase subunit I [Legionellales bacterium]|nr:cytochrome ubiquinol oxidase subunit I [Legionellales bacterium]
MLTELLSRIQFAFTIGFHILFPTLNLGLAVFICAMEAVWLKTQNPLFLRICQFWTKIFAITFGMGVVSGIVLAYELGTNFGPFISVFGPILGALFSYETLTAFFLEAGFLGVMLFGWNKLPPKLHFFATFMVAIGTTFSAFWILSANSWMQTPAGFVLEKGQYLATSWYEVIFNPSFMPRLFHMLLASYVTTSFVIAGICAWYLLKKQHLDLAKPCFSIATAVALIVVPLQMYVGDSVGLEVQRNQPIKTAAMEGVWETQRGAPLLLFAIPDQATEQNYFKIEIPKLASLLNTHSFDGELIGLKSVPAYDRPPVIVVFFAFRIMVGIGLLLLLVALIGGWLRWRKRLYETSWFLRLCVAVIPLGFIATVAGWFTAEVGRQPWVVYNIMRVSDAVSPITTHEVATSLTLFVIVYVTIFSFYLYYLLKLIRRGPQQLEQDAHEHHLFQYMTQEHKPHDH